MDDMVTDYWAHHYAEHGAKDEIEDEDFDLKAELARIEQEDDEDDWEEVKLE